MPNKSGQTVTTSTVTTSEDYTQLTIPEAGYYSTNSKIQTLSSNVSSVSKIAKGDIILSSGDKKIELDFEPDYVGCVMWGNRI